MSEQEEAIALCWHCDRSPRAEGQLLCNDCLEAATGELVALILAHLDRPNALTRERDELRAALEAAAEKFQRIQWVALPSTMVMARAMDGEQAVRDALDTLTNKAGGGEA
jgi:hypothetical protein